MKSILFLLLFAMVPSAYGQSSTDRIALVDSGRDCSIRGLSIPDSRTVWVSGSNGSVGRSTDGGSTFHWITVSGYEKRDFRDIHAFDSSTAIIMGIGNPACILKTADGGKSWTCVFQKDAPGMFLDAMDFKNAHEGICIGDPLPAGSGDKRFYILRTHDGGNTWTEENHSPKAAEGEAVFSASGSNIALGDEKVFDYAFISGGSVSRLYRVRESGSHVTRILSLQLPMAQGSESAGAFSMTTDRKKKFYCVGGDYRLPDAEQKAFACTEDGGITWTKPAKTQPSGYRSCVCRVGKKFLVACGTNGVDLGKGPASWQRISSRGFNVCAPTPDGKTVFFAGSRGTIGVLRM